MWVQTRRFTFLKHISEDDIKIINGVILMSMVDDIMTLLMDSTQILKYYTSYKEIK